MKRYHHFMLTSSLVLSAGVFSVGCWLLSRAIYHKQRYNILEDEYVEREYLGEYNAYCETLMQDNGSSLQIKWVEADPCSDFDPMHPDYVDNWRK